MPDMTSPAVSEEFLFPKQRTENAKQFNRATPPPLPGFDLISSSRWPSGPVIRTFVQYLIAFCSLPETASHVISGMFVGPTVHDKR